MNSNPTFTLISSNGNGPIFTPNAGNDIDLDVTVLNESEFNLLLGDENDNTFLGTGDNDAIAGFGGDDLIRGNGGNDVIDGGAGNDNLDGDFGDDIVFGGDGNDVITDFRGNDTLDGGNGTDNIFGFNGNDVLFGGAGDDIVEGGNDDDIISGGSGNDTLTGGERNGTSTSTNPANNSEDGADIFVFEADSLGADTITDFQDGIDRIDLTDFNLNSTQLQSIIDGAQQVGNDTLLTFASNNTARLQNTQVGAIDTADFLISPNSASGPNIGLVEVSETVSVNGVVTGTSAAEVFVVSNDDLNNFAAIIDFQDGRDRIDLSQTNITSFEDFIDNQSFASGGVSFGSGNSTTADQTGNLVGTAQGGLIVYGDNLTGSQTFLDASDFTFA